MKKRRILLGLLFASMIMGVSSCISNTEDNLPDTKDEPAETPVNPDTPDNPDISDGGDSGKEEQPGNTPDTPSPETPDEPDTPDLGGDVGTQGEVQILESSGHLEAAYVEWSPVQDATSYHVYYKKQGAGDSSYIRVSDMLIRKYAEYYRVDIVGLAAGDYEIKVVPVVQDTEKSFYSTAKMTVIAHDRSGYAFSSLSPVKTGSGAYNDDGTLKSNAEVIYITAKTAKTVKCTLGGVEYTGFQSILDGKQKSGDTKPIDFRIVGKVSLEDLDHISSSEEGLQLKGKSNYSQMNITIEGIGEDSTIYGFGILVKNCANVEIRNLGIMYFLDDGISINGGNCNLWVHNCDFFYGKPGSAKDQVKGDGSLDIKGTKYASLSYNHFWDSGKTHLNSNGDEVDYITYHHNWYDHSDSRHPRVRLSTAIHVYNNYFDGNAKYGIGATRGSSIFVEGNYFRNCKNPMMSSLQGTDKLAAEGTFSKETGGMIKAYNNTVVGASSLVYANSDLGTIAGNATSFDAYLASSRDETVPSSYTTLSGGTAYSNFDTASDFYSYTADSPEAARDNVMKYAGRMNGGDLQWEFDNAVEDTNYEIIPELKELIVGYQSSILKILGEDSQDASGSGSASGNESENNPNPDTPVSPSIEGAVVHNFTTSGKESTIFAITGNLATSKGTQTYNGETLTQCLKLESSTSITFTLDKPMTLILVLGNGGTYSGQTVKVDGEKLVSDSNGIVTIELASGAHTISKADTSNIFLIALAEI